MTTPDRDDLPRPEFDDASGWQTRVWDQIDRGDREPPGPSWGARWLPWIVPALVLAVIAALCIWALSISFGGAR